MIKKFIEGTYELPSIAYQLLQCQMTEILKLVKLLVQTLHYNS